MIDNIPTGIVVFFIGQTVTAAWALITMYFDIRSLKTKMIEIDNENKEIKQQLKELSDTLILVKNNTDLLLLGRIKTAATR